MKNIKIITYDNFPFGGAPANYLRYFSLSLSLIKENNIEVVLPTGNYGSRNNFNANKNDKIQKVKYIHLGFRIHPSGPLGKLFDNILGLILPFFYFISERIKNNVDQIIIYNTRFTITFPFLLIKWIIGKKLTIILPEFYEKPSKKFIFAYVQWLNFYFSIKYIVRFADRFIVLTDYLKNYLISQNISSEKILLLPNITDPSIFNLTNVKEFRNDIITIGYCGTPTRKDGIDDLIESYSILAKSHINIHLLIIGDSPNGLSVLPALKEKTTKLGISGKVTFTGSVPFQEVPKLLNSCQILALTRPSGVFAEAGFPTKLGEYFACKKPVLVTSVGDINKYFVNEIHAIIVKPGDIENIVKGFDKLIIDKTMGEKMIVNAYNWLNDNLDYKGLSFKIDNFLL